MRFSRAATIGRAAVLTAIAYFLASGFTALAVDPVSTAAVLGPSLALASTREPVADGNAILARNIFGGALRDRGPGLPVDAAACADTSVRLVSTLVARNPSSSFAAVAMEGGTRLVRAGATVAGGTLERIGWREVRVRMPAGHECSLAMFAGRSTTIGRAPAPVPGPDPAANGVQVLGDGEVVVDRALVDRLLASPGELSRLARVRPRLSDGFVDGVQVFGVRRAGLLAQIGLRNGDVVRSVNGHDVADPRAALDALERLPSTERFEVQIERAGAPRTLRIEVR